MAGLEPVIRAAAQECVGRLRDEGETDLVAVLGKPLPGVAVAHLLGVAPDDRADLDRWTDAIVSGGDALSGAGGVKAAVLELATAFAALIDERRRLIDDPGLVPNAVEELLRLSSPLQAIGRTATRDVELHGRVIPEGRKVLLLYGSANRDPREFGPDAEDLDVGRRIDRLVAFGSGAHHCVGAAVARLQARVAIQELLATCPDFEVDLDAIEYAPGTVVRRPCAMPVTAG